MEIAQAPYRPYPLRSRHACHRGRKSPSMLAASPPDAPRGFSFFGRQRESAPVDVPGVSAGQVIGDFRLVRPLGQGGMGQVWEAVQRSLGRTVALKLVRPERITEKTLALFAREARAGGRLHHPHLVSVHAHGTSDNVAWIAMELVEGSWTLRDFLDDVAKSGEVPAEYYRDVAEFVARVADGMQAAHASGVIHRDLKPQNILIDSEDRPKVTDFGLAKLTDESALSVTGEFAGTYWYTSPEQVAAKRMGLDHRADIFSLGVVLYEMLAQRRPFDGDTTHQVAEQVLTFDPPDLRTVRSRIPRDLAVITAKCLEKARDRRYATMAELAADLRRHLANEPIHAKPPSRLVKLMLWARRNPTKSVAGGVAAVAFGVISVLLAENVKKTQRLGEANTNLGVANSSLGAANATLATTNTTLEQTIGERDGLISELSTTNESLAAQTRRAEEAAEAQRLTAEAEKRRADEVLRLSAIQDYEDLIAKAEDLWPADPDKVEAYERWIGEAQALVDELPRHYAKRDELRALALSQTAEEREADRQAHPEFPKLAELAAALKQAQGTDGSEGKEPTPADPVQVTALESELAALRARLDERQDWRFPEGKENARWWNANLSKLITPLEALKDPRSGLLSPEPEAVSEAYGWSVPRRLEFARTIHERSVSGAEASRLWAEAIAAIEASPKYGDLKLTPQLGLLPIGMDPDSELWEFAHLQTGEPAVRGADGRLVLTEATGVVLVLIPKGTFWMGAQSTDPNGRNFDAQAAGIESPVHEVTLSAHFLAKHETTQGQWLRVSGRNPSSYQGGNLAPTLLHPVEQVSWLDSVDWTRRIGLSLPSEAQWEYGARGGTDTPWWTGTERESLRGKVNLADQTAKKGGAPWSDINDWPDLEDGIVVHSEVGRYAANRFGLHEVAGNLWEWCLDGFGNYSAAFSTDPVAPAAGSANRVGRGGCFNSAASNARSALRSTYAPGARVNDFGLRFAKGITP